MTELLWAYVFVMVGTAAWFLRWSRDPKGIPASVYWLVIAILLWSGGWHAIMGLGGGQWEGADHSVHWARYADWLVTAPLLAVALALTGTHTVPGKRRRLVVALIALAASMILGGLAGELTTGRTARSVWYGVGMAALLGIIGLIWGPLRATAERQPAEIARSYLGAAFSLSLLWICFPLAWALGPLGFGILGDATSAVVFVVLSLLTKVVWSVVDVGRLRALADRGDFYVA